MVFSKRSTGGSLTSARDCRVVGESAEERTGGLVEDAGLADFLRLHSQPRNVQTAGELAHLSLRERAAFFNGFLYAGENKFLQ